jgi:hypothetical protein
MVTGNTSRSRHRRTDAHAERGAAVFLVVLILSLVTAIGIFAMRSASLADVAAGFDREGAQASLIAQYGITATAAYTGTGYTDTIVGTMKHPAQGFVPPRCESNGVPMSSPQTNPAPPCYLLSQAALQTSFSSSSNESIFAPTNKGSAVATSTSSLNVNEKTDATFLIEFTDLAATGVAPQGMPADRVQYEVTLTSIAQVRPIEACSGGVQSTPNAAQAVVRSIITFGGIP